METVSFFEHNGYSVRLKAKWNSGFGYKIFKSIHSEKSPDGLKKIYLREEQFDFISPEVLKNKAKNYIDNFSERLEEKFIRLTKNN